MRFDIGGLQLGLSDTAKEQREIETIEPLDTTATITADTARRSTEKGAIQIGYEYAQLQYGGEVEDEAFLSVFKSFPDYTDNAKYYDEWKNIDKGFALPHSRERHNLGINNNRFALDENNNVVAGSSYYAGAELLYNMDAIKGALLAKKNGYNEDMFNAEYKRIGKEKLAKLEQERAGKSSVGMLVGGLAGHIAQPETAIEFMSPSKIMGSTIAKGAAKAFGAEFAVGLVGETLREERIREFKSRVEENYTMWDSVQNILIGAGLAGTFRGIGSAVSDKITFNKIKDTIPNTTDKEIFERFARRENYKLTENSQKHLDLMEKVREDLDNGIAPDISQHTDIDIESKMDEEIEPISLIEELKALDIERGVPEATQAFEREFDEVAPLKEIDDTSEFDGMATRAEAEAIMDEVAEFSPEIKAELNWIRQSSTKLSPRAEQVKRAAEIKIGGSEDETAQEVKNLFRENTSDEARFKKMNKADIDELDRMHREELMRDKPKDMSEEDWIEANAVFARGGDNILAGTISGVGQDEEGNITFDAEKFVLGLGGYTAVKQMLKNPQVQQNLKNLAQKAIDMIDMNPQVYKERGFNAMFVGSKGDEQARATQHRRNMTPEQRASEDWTKTLKRTEGKYDEPIIKFDDKGKALFVFKKKAKEKGNK